MLRCALLAVVVGLAAVALSSAQSDIGVLPVGADGKPLNLDFETGTLKDWTATGDAFKDQPNKGDTVFVRRSDSKSQHQGNYWIGGYEKHGDKPQGTLTSVAFKVTHPWASFLVGGGASLSTSVELVRKDNGQVFFRASGTEQENMRRVVVDLQPHKDREIFIRLVDKASGGWGHINFDDFRFHSAKPNLPQKAAPLTPDVYKYAGLPAKKAAEVMTVPDGFTVKLFAGEPDVMQPIAFCIDDRGRLWVAEAYGYPARQPEGKGKDRIIILEDVDGDGHFDKRTVFMEGLNLVSGIEVGFGGVWIGAAPNFIFVPIKAGEDKPAGPPKILLDGWGYQDTHETLNTFTWGPDGWLYGCHGVFTHSKVGKPGTPAKERTPINAGVWRYHPTRHVFEVFAHGTSNPWGLDFNEYGQAFVEACVIPHNWHIIQGARYQRQGGVHFNPHTYADIPTIAEHRHYLGANPHGGNGKSDSAGGGHAHSGAMIYQGGAWPEEYRGKMFMGNIHGHRLNIDILQPKGSGYVARPHPDFLLSHDKWAMFVNLQAGPDGNVFVIDWYDKQSCHTGNVQVWDRTNGRIYKICHKDAKPAAKLDLAKMSDWELMDLQLSPNEWYVRHARRILQERAVARPEANKITQGSKLPPELTVLGMIANTHKEADKRLRALWVLHGIGWHRFHVSITDADARVRGWTIQLALEEPGRVDAALLDKLADLAQVDPSPVVRLYLASGAQRLPLEKRWDILRGLVAHAEDSTDHNLPLMYWYAAEQLAERDAAKALDLALAAKVPPLPTFMSRRIASIGTAEALALLVDRLAKATNDNVRLAVVRGLQDGLKGRRDVAMPHAWPQAFALLAGSNNAELRNGGLALAVTFGDAKALDTLRVLLASAQTELPARQKALAVLLSARDLQLVPVLHQLLGEPLLRGDAIRALASYDDPKTPQLLVALYPSLNTLDKRDALNTLASRPAYGKALLDAVAAKKIAVADISADLVRQLTNLGDKALDQRIGEVWGVVRSTPADRARLIAEWKKSVTAAGKAPDLTHGRALYAKTCMQCHTLFGAGGTVGPDITGANRASVDYLLENIFDPSAVIPKEYTSTILELKNGRIVTGIVKGEGEGAPYTVVTVNETLTIPRGDVDSMKPSNISMMPDDQLKGWSKDDVRALIAYLQSPKQVPILATPENAKDFFNGKDLTFWDGDPKLWSVQNGEIVGTSKSLKKNEWLRSHMLAGDFKLTLQVKLVPNAGNSGVQFRSEVLPDGDLKGPQADIGEGWWGKLYEEHGRGLLWKESGEKHLKVGNWNEYTIEAKGSKVRTWLNGKLCVDLNDPQITARGVFALQLHSGGAFEVRFKDLRLEVYPAGK